MKKTLKAKFQQKICKKWQTYTFLMGRKVDIFSAEGFYHVTVYVDPKNQKFSKPTRLPVAIPYTALKSEGKQKLDLDEASGLGNRVSRGSVLAVVGRQEHFAEA